MATISELMAEKVPGSVKITTNDFGPYRYFIPYFIDHYGQCHGLDHQGHDDFWNDGLGDWRLWQEPKKTVKKVLWINVTNEYGVKAVWQDPAQTVMFHPDYVKTNIEAEFEE